MLTDIPQFTAPSYQDRTLNRIQKCVNLYPEKTADGWNLVSTSGYVVGGGGSQVTGNNEACNGAYMSTTGKLFSAHKGIIYEWDTLTGAAPTSRGTVTASTTGSVFFADNGTQLFIVDSAGLGYTLVMTAGSVTIVPDANFPSASSVTFQDGYFIVSKTNTGEFYISALYDGTVWTPVIFETAESKGDRLVSVFSNGQILYAIGEQTIEFYQNSGNAGTPFSRINGSTLQFGCVGKTAWSSLNGIVYLYGASAGGSGTIWEISGTSARVLSTPVIEAYTGPDSVFGGTIKNAHCFRQDGHSFFEFQAGSSAWCYDITQGAWLERTSYLVGGGGVYTADSINFAIQSVAGLGTNLYLFNQSDGKQFVITATRANSDNGNPTQRLRIFGPIESRTKKLFHYQIRIEADVWYDSGSTASSISATLDWTNDNGQTYSTAITLTAATTASSTAAQRVIWVANRLGSAACRYYRLTMAGPAAKIVLKSCAIDLKEGSS